MDSADRPPRFLVRQAVALGQPPQPSISAVHTNTNAASSSYLKKYYSLMQKPMPRFVRPARKTDPLVVSVNKAKPATTQARVGVRAVVHYPSGPPLHPTRDPLAIAASRQSTSAASGASATNKSSESAVPQTATTTDTGTGINR